MTAICGIVGGGEGANSRSVRRMIRCMQHRGGDVPQILSPGKDSSLPPIVLGISDRADVGRSHDRLGFFSQSNKLLVVDGRVSNLRALRNRLASEGVSFDTTSDAEVMLRAIDSWGPQAIDKLEGGFAIAYFNRFTNSLLLARDKMGAKPLFYAQAPGLIVFASEVRAILAAGIVSPQIDVAGLATCLAYGGGLTSRTMHSAIKSLPAATYLIVTISPSGIDAKEFGRFWSPPGISPEPKPGEDALLSVHNSLEQILATRSAVDSQRCVLLSDGLASAYLAATANTFVPGTASFTVGVDSITGSGTLKDSASAFGFGHYKREHVTDAIRDAAASAIALGLRHHQVVVDSEWFARQVPEWLRFMDQPTVGGLNESILMSAAIERGFKEQVSGFGAAEMLGCSRGHRIVPKVMSMLNRTRLMPARFREHMVARLLGRNSEALVDPRFLCSEGTPFRRAMRLHRVFGNEALASLGLGPEQLVQDADLLDEELLAADVASGNDVLQGIMRAESSWALSSLGQLTSASDICGADVRTPFMEPVFQEAIALVSRQSFAALAKRHGSLLQGLAATTLPLEIVKRPQNEWSLQRYAWRYYSLSEEYAKHAEAFITSGIAPPSLLRRLWNEAQSKSDQRQAVIMAAVGSYLAELPKTIDAARQAPD